MKNISLTNKAWFWFTLGFSLAFLVVALVWPMPFFDGQIVRRTMLWQYYMLEIQSALKSSGNLGPKTGNAFLAMGALAIHTAVAAAVGVVSALLGRAMRRKVSGA
jgi:Zn-dependent protease